MFGRRSRTVKVDISEFDEIIASKNYALQNIIHDVIKSDKSLLENHYMLVFKVFEKIIQTDDKFADYELTVDDFSNLFKYGTVTKYPKLSTIVRAISGYRD